MFWRPKKGFRPPQYRLQPFRSQIASQFFTSVAGYPLLHNSLLKPIETLTKDYIPDVGGGNMYFRVSIAQINPEQKEAFVARADELRDAMQALPGLQSVTFVQTSEGEAVGLAVYDSEESFMKAAPLVVEIMGGFAEFFTAPPEQRSGPVIWSM